jgi:hypothetical protein
MPSFLTNFQAGKSGTDVLAVFCSDHRFQGAIHDFLERGLGLNAQYDLLVIPGGPQSLTLVEYLPKFAWAGWKWFRFLVDSHQVKRLILIAHHDCMWYKTLPFHLRTSGDPRVHQEDDLRRVAGRLKQDFPALSVELYFASVDDEGCIAIDSI